MTTEYWANVYPHVADPVKIGGKFKSRLRCEAFRGDFAAFRIHVRLKPEGAPRRYANENNRRAWEKHEDWCRDHVARGTDPTFLSVWEGL